MTSPPGPGHVIAGIGGCLDMAQRDRDLVKGTADSAVGSGQVTGPQLQAPAKWKMAIATFVGAYIVTAIAIPPEIGWLPHSWSFYEGRVSCLTRL